MSTALKLTTLASSFGLLGASALYTLRTPSRDFAPAATALEHTADFAAVKPKMPSNFFSFSIGKYEFSNAS